MPDRRRSVAVGVGAVVLATIGIVAASEDEDYDYAGVCVDRATQARLDDETCEDDDEGGGGSGGAHGWYFVPRGVSAPAVGQRATGGSFAAPAGDASWGSGFRSEGGVVTRGGFSGHGFSFGG